MSVLNSTVKLRLFQLFIGGTSGNLIKPFFTAILAMGIGATLSATAMVGCGLVALLVGLSGGTHADKAGRKRILFYSEWVRLAGAVLLWSAFFSSEINYFVAIIGFLLHSSGSAYGRPAGDALLYDNMNESNRKLIMRLHYWIWNLTVLLGYILGGVFFIENKPVFFTLLISVSLIDLVIIRLLKDREGYGTLTISDWSIKRLPLGLLRSDLRFAAFSLGSSLQLIVEVGSIALLSVVMLEENIVWSIAHYELAPLAFFGVLITMNAIILLLGGLLQMKFLSTIDARLELWIGIFLLIIGFGGMFVTQMPEALLLCVAALSVGELFYKSSRNEIFTQILPDDQKGAYSSINSTLFRVASAIAPIMLALYDWVPASLITITVAILLLFTGTLLNHVASTLTGSTASVT